MTGSPDIPLIISVDDHVVEPPTLWTDRLPSKYADRAPRVERDKAKFHFEGGVFSYERGVEDGQWCDWWLYDDLVYPFPKLSAAIGFDDLDVTPTTFDEIRPGCWIQSDRLADMTANHVEASVCFPNTLPRFWDPLFRACEETGTVVCMHIGSSSKMPATSPDAPFIVSSTLTFSNAMGSMLDYIFSGTLDRFPGLTIAYSEGQVGWMPYVLERADKLWAERGDNSFGTSLPQKPSSYVHHRIYGCVFDDEIGLKNRDV